MSDELDDVEALVRGAQVATTQEFDERVMAAASAPRPRMTRAARWAAGIIVAIAIGGALTAAAVEWLRGRSGSEDGAFLTNPVGHTSGDSRPEGLEPADRARAGGIVERSQIITKDQLPPSLFGSSEPEVEEETVLSYSFGLSPNADARATFRDAPLVARVRLDVEGGSSSHGNRVVRGEIVALYKGDPSLVGRKVLLHEKHRESRTSLLCWGSASARRVAAGLGTFVMPLETTNVGVSTTGPIHLRLALGEGLNGTPVAMEVPDRPFPAAEDEMVKALRDDLVTSLANPDPFVRVGAITALSRWQGTRTSRRSCSEPDATTIPPFAGPSRT
jgi:hypothetical protein